MEEPPPYEAPPPVTPPPPAMSLVARLLSVFAMPGEVFAGVKAGRVSVANWLVPALLSALVCVLLALVLVSQPSRQKQMHERFDQQAKALDQQVKAGKLKQADVDRTMALPRLLMQPPVLKVVGGVLATAFGVVRVFWWALILWVLGRAFLRVRFGYIKALEVAGLALMVSILGTIVTLLLTLNLSKLFTVPSLALVVPDFEARWNSPLRQGVSTAFALWMVAVLGVGLGKLADLPFGRVAWLVLAVWVLQESLLVLAGGMFG
jgi:Yip1 domain